MLTRRSVHMRVGRRSRLASGRMGKAILLGLGAIVMLIRGSDVALGQGNTNTTAQPPLFTAIDLHPAGFKFSLGSGISGREQVGEASVEDIAPHHALLWRGSASSAVDLTPGGFIESEARGVCAGQHVG